MTDVAIVGASGYGGGELVRWLHRHPSVRIRALLSETYAGKPLAAAFPGTQGLSDLQFSSAGDLSAVTNCEVVFLAGESGFAMCHAGQLLKAGCKVIDLSGDFRFKDAASFGAWYGAPHSNKQLLGDAIYGITELHHESIKCSSLIGNPGCYATAAILALAPLVKHKLIDLDSIVIDGKSGIWRYKRFTTRLW